MAAKKKGRSVAEIRQPKYLDLVGQTVGAGSGVVAGKVGLEVTRPMEEEAFASVKLDTVGLRTRLRKTSDETREQMLSADRLYYDACSMSGPRASDYIRFLDARSEARGVARLAHEREIAAEALEEAAAQIEAVPSVKQSIAAWLRTLATRKRSGK